MDAMSVNLSITHPASPNQTSHLESLYKDFNPALLSLKTEITNRDEFLLNLKKRFLDKDHPYGSDGTNHHGQEPGRVEDSSDATPITIKKSRDDEGSKNPSNSSNPSGKLGVGAPLFLSRPKSVNGAIQIPLHQKESVYEGYLKRVKSVELKKGQNEMGRGQNEILNSLTRKENHREKRGNVENEEIVSPFDQSLYSSGVGIQISIESDIPKLQKVNYSIEIEKSELQLCSMKKDDDKYLMDFLSQVDQLIEKERVKEEERKPTDAHEMSLPDDLAQILSFPRSKQGSNQSMMKNEVINIDECLLKEDDFDEEFIIKSPTMEISKRKTVMNTWNVGNKQASRKPITFMDVMKETKEKYQSTGRIRGMKAPGGQASRIVATGEVGLRKQQPSMIGLLSSPQQFVDPAVHLMEKQMDIWMHLVNEMRKRTKTKKPDQSKKTKKKFIDPVHLILSLNQLGLSANIMHRVDLSVLRVILAIKSWRKKALDTRSHRSLPIRKLIQTYDKQLVCGVPLPIQFQIKEYAAQVMRLCVKRYSTLIGPNHSKTIRCRKWIRGLEESVVTEFGLEEISGDLGASMADGTFHRPLFLQCCFGTSSTTPLVLTDTTRSSRRKGGEGGEEKAKMNYSVTVMEKSRKVFPMDELVEEDVGEEEEKEDKVGYIKSDLFSFTKPNKVFPIEEMEV